MLLLQLLVTAGVALQNSHDEHKEVVFILTGTTTNYPAANRFENVVLSCKAMCTTAAIATFVAKRLRQHAVNSCNLVLLELVVCPATNTLA